MTPQMRDQLPESVPQAHGHHGGFVFFFTKTRPFRIELSFIGTSFKVRASSTGSGIRCIGSRCGTNSPPGRVNVATLRLRPTFPFIRIRRKERPKTVVAEKNIYWLAANRLTVADKCSCSSPGGLRD